MKQNIVILKDITIDFGLHFQNIVKCTLVLCSFLKSIVGLTAHNRVNVLTTLPSFEVFIMHLRAQSCPNIFPCTKKRKLGSPMKNIGLAMSYSICTVAG